MLWAELCRQGEELGCVLCECKVEKWSVVQMDQLGFCPIPLGFHSDSPLPWVALEEVT